MVACGCIMWPACDRGASPSLSLSELLEEEEEEEDESLDEAVSSLTFLDGMGSGVALLERIGLISCIKFPGSFPKTGIDRDAVVWVICPPTLMRSPTALFVFLSVPCLALLSCWGVVDLFPVFGVLALDFACPFCPRLFAADFPEPSRGVASWDFPARALDCMWAG